MSFRTICGRTVTIRPRATGAGGRDGYGNKVVAFDDDVVGFPARREQVAATEDVADRDQQAEEFRYLIALRNADGVLLADLSGRSRIVDGDEVWSIVGTPDLVGRRRRPHHWEARVERIEG